MSANADTPAALLPENIAEALRLIRPYVRHTPVLRVDMADFGGASYPVDLKLESLQHSGSFKARGAFASLMTQDIPAAGVVAASGGNHGAAVAYAAMKRGVPATIFVPEIASPAKAERIRSYGARLEIGGERYADALAASELFVKESGALPIHAYDQRTTLLAAGRPVEAEAGSIAADSLAPRQVGEMMFPLARDYVAQSVLVSDDDIRNAQKALWNSVRVVTEPGGAAAFAALLAGRYVPEAGEKVAVLVCGANTSAVSFS